MNSGDVCWGYILKIVNNYYLYMIRFYEIYPRRSNDINNIVEGGKLSKTENLSTKWRHKLGISSRDRLNWRMLFSKSFVESNSLETLEKTWTISDLTK